jgi:hypothetical protein
MATFFTTCKSNNLDLPYVHKALPNPVSIKIELEFEGSMPSLMLQLMDVLRISKESNITKRDKELQVPGCLLDFFISLPGPQVTDRFPRDHPDRELSICITIHALNFAS